MDERKIRYYSLKYMQGFLVLGDTISNDRIFQFKASVCRYFTEKIEQGTDEGGEKKGCNVSMSHPCDWRNNLQCLP